MNIPKMTDADSKEYERFLKEGPQEGLTQVEIIGIYKADKQTALNMKSKSVVLGKDIGGGKNSSNPYSYLEDGPNVGPGKNFTAAQKQKMLEEKLYLENLIEWNGIIRGGKV